MDNFDGFCVSFPGGWGVTYDYRMLWPGEFTVALDRDKYTPYGLFGGNTGQGSGLVVVVPGADEAIYTRISGISIPAGTVLSHRTAGGGGYGDPMEREAQAVLEDVLDEFITVDDARELYGVAINPASMTIDEAATLEQRGTR